MERERREEKGEQKERKIGKRKRRKNRREQNVDEKGNRKKEENYKKGTKIKQTIAKLKILALLPPPHTHIHTTLPFNMDVTRHLAFLPAPQ